MSMMAGRRLSPLRLSIAVVVTGGVLAGGVYGVTSAVADITAPPIPSSWFAGYVDATDTPAYAFETPVSDAAKNVVLSFIVSDPSDACTPSWGAAYSLDEAATSLDLDRRMARLTQAGGEVMVSFGGQANSELANGCTDASALERAYESVVSRYSLTTIDLDLEGDALDTAAVARRATAIAALQSAQRAAGSDLAVWLTLPSTPDGLSSQGTDAVAAFLAAGVDIAGVNAMTMDFGDSKAATQSMGDASIAALTSLHRQLDALYTAAGTHLSSRTLWAKEGATPMIGQNDTAGEVFTLDDATALQTFAAENGVTRLSMWELSRDATCGANYADVTVVSNQCSGVDESVTTFAKTLGTGFTGSPAASASTRTTPDPETTVAADDPATSPYPIWSASAVYLVGTKIVWHHNVYEAKWWTRGDQPDDPVLDIASAPWTLIGPVLPGETPVPQPTLAAGTYPAWSGTTTYLAGDRVLVNGVPFQAKWWTKGDDPIGTMADSESSPWQRLTDAQIAAIEKAAAAKG